MVRMRQGPRPRQKSCWGWQKELSDEWVHDNGGREGGGGVQNSWLRNCIP